MQHVRVLVAAAILAASCLPTAADPASIPSPGNQVIEISRSMAASVSPADFQRLTVGVYTLSFVAREIWSSAPKLVRGDAANLLTIQADGTFVFDHTVEIAFRMGNGTDRFPPGRRFGRVDVARGAQQRLELAHQADPMDDAVAIGHAGYASKDYDTSDRQHSIFESDLAGAKALGAIHREEATEFLILQFYAGPENEIWFFVKAGV